MWQADEPLPREPVRTPKERPTDVQGSLKGLEISIQRVIKCFALKQDSLKMSFFLRKKTTIEDVARFLRVETSPGWCGMQSHKTCSPAKAFLERQKELLFNTFKAFEAIFLLETEKPLLQTLIFGCGFIALTAFSGLVPQPVCHISPL